MITVSARRQQKNKKMKLLRFYRGRMLDCWMVDDDISLCHRITLAKTEPRNKAAHTSPHTQEGRGERRQTLMLRV